MEEMGLEGLYYLATIENARSCLRQMFKSIDELIDLEANLFTLLLPLPFSNPKRATLPHHSTSVQLPPNQGSPE